MSFCVYFDFSVGINRTMYAPTGSLQKLLDEFSETEGLLGLGSTEADWHWSKIDEAIRKTSKKILCKTIGKHNSNAAWLYEYGIKNWTPEPTEKNTDEITPELAASFWFKLRRLNVPVEKWTGDYYEERMNAIYSALRKESTYSSEGMIFEGRKLSPKQAASVIILFSQWLDHDDIRLDVPNGHDSLARSDNGGYEWCEKCGAVADDDVMYQAKYCRKRQCPIKEQYAEND